MIQHHILRNKVKKHLLHQIQQQELQIGKTINLAKLSRELHISVTPIREALSQLEQARILQAVPNRGFIIPKLTYQNAVDLYETIAQLEVLALEQAIFKPQTITDLKMQQTTLRDAEKLKARLQARQDFHRILLRDCRNSILKSLLEDLMARVQFYEQLFITEPKFYKKVDQQNEGIISAIEEDNIPTATLLLKMNRMAIAEHVKGKLILEKEVYHETIVPNK